MQYKPHPYQEHATAHVMDNPASGLFLEMGLGKTVATLTAVNDLLFDSLEVQKVLVIAPKRVAEHTWTTEAAKWDHLRHLRIAKVIGTESQRKEALRAKADIFVINRENVVWLVGHYGTSFPFDMIVIDELSSFKSAKAARFKALRKIRPQVKRVVGLTGTPAPNSLLDLWPQLYLLDMGQRLGNTISGYRERYFTPAARHGQIVTSYKIRPMVEQTIYEKIGDICISMKAKDYLTLPERIDQPHHLQLPPDIMAKYLDFEEKQVLALVDIDDISAVNAAALTTKLLQFCNGAVYSEKPIYHEIHEEKLDELEEIIEAANGKPVLVFYLFDHDQQRILHRLKSYKPIKLKGPEHIDQWNRGEIPILLAHPASAGHGLNMQDGGNIIAWFGLPWSLELFQQAIARIHRQGQLQIVINHFLVTAGTVEEDVIKALQNKAEGQDQLMEAVKARVKNIHQRLKKSA